MKIRDRGAAGDGERIRFTSAILPLWARRTKSLDALLPVLYLRGISTGDFQEALAALLGKDAPNLSPAVISRLTAEWQGEYERWQKRDLSARRYVYVWADDARRPSREGFTEKQGQYLAFIYAYSRIFRRAPAETDMQRHFRFSPPSVHQMVLTLERGRPDSAVSPASLEASNSSLHPKTCLS